MQDIYNGYTSLLINKSRIRAHIRRKYYIKNILRFVKGKTIDFGCGVGEVLKYLPTGSIGLDPDQSSIEYCRRKKLNVYFYDPKKDKYNFDFLKNKNFETMLLNHVLEHIDSPVKVMTKILKESKKLDLCRVIVVVPCKKGFKADQTHIKYIDNDFFENKLQTKYYKIIHKSYYPINKKFIGDLLRHQELVVVYEKVKLK